jgi:cyclopropane fatty-acyl-phospholipid synthase-like methyltransferase
MNTTTYAAYDRMRDWHHLKNQEFQSVCRRYKKGKATWTEWLAAYGDKDSADAEMKEFEQAWEYTKKEVAS